MFKILFRIGFLLNFSTARANMKNHNIATEFGTLIKYKIYKIKKHDQNIVKPHTAYYKASKSLNDTT